MHILCIHCVQLTFCSRSGILFAKIEALFIVESIKLKPSKSGWRHWIGNWNERHNSSRSIFSSSICNWCWTL